MCFLIIYNQKVGNYIKKSFEDVHLDVKIYQISPASQWNSTTAITLGSSGGSGDLNLLNWFVCDFLYALQRAAVQNPLLFEFETDIPSAVY